MQQVRVQQGVPISFGAKIHVDKTGLFAPKLEYLKSMYGAKLDMYIVAAEDIKPEWDMMTSNSKATLGMGLAVQDNIANGENSVVKKLISSENTYKAGAGADAAKYDSAEAVTVQGELIEFEKTGDYYVIFGVSGADESALTAGAKLCYYIRLSKLTFVEVSASVSASCDVSEIEVDGEAKIDVKTVGYDGNPISGTISYTSSAPSVATVDNTGKVVGKSEGQATITASVSYEGQVYSDTVEITVVPKDEGNAGKTFEYILGTMVMSDSARAAAQAQEAAAAKTGLDA
ncbi:MAG: Ig-like domain-containing protein, partial [Oscillospiraceae bacterium]|nr:Ig-like domain-containing protein [Oscillospiraceae bacterium]